MIKDIFQFSIKLVVVAAILLLTHWYILKQLYSGPLYFPLWQIYLFNVVLVLGMYFLLRYYGVRKPNGILKIFMLLSLLKMAFVIIFLLPLFLDKAVNTQVEVTNFFVPYFALLAFEIFALNRFLQKA